MLHASQVNSWTVEYLAGRKYEAQLAFKRKSSPGASGRSQPATPWSVARQEPCVKAEGLCHCVQMFPLLSWLPQNTQHTHTMHKPWCRDDLTQSKHLTQTPSLTHIHKHADTKYVRTAHVFPLHIRAAQPRHFLVSSIATSTTSVLLSGAAGNNKVGFKWALQGLKHTSKCRKVPLKCSSKQLLLTS